MQSMPDSMMKRNIGSAKRKKTSSALLEAKNWLAKHLLLWKKR